MTVLRTCRLSLVTLLLAASTLMLATPSYACACGAAVAPSGTQATMNNEVALVHWDGSTETIVMQLALNATADSVALVVPTPTPATVTSAGEATFTELGSLTAPQTQQRRRWKLGLILFAGASRTGAAHTGAPSVVNQVNLGPLEATTLTGGDLSGLQKWLSDNGYAIRPAVTDALDPYVRDGWSFVAIRLTSAAPIVGGLDPVRMTFQSSQLVYPMRLSVAAPDAQQVTVYTLSDHRQQRTDADATKQSTEVQFAGNVSGAVHDPLLRELAGDHGAYLTKFAVNIPAPKQISSDFSFGNAPNDDAYRQVVYEDHDIVIPLELVIFAVLVFAAITAAVIVVVAVRSGSRRA
ncbi:MAG: DUF2330 domain-containing protein [Mycobacterium sp.]|uniref:DUF2330 domain-containing protein n=1 Tax=Mycobacterium sp. TaxID=1785 RepID=UPI001EC64F61|nr:DUF2330 domain-containing protein [Mycobacterium sp.]MBW0017307.1 DUF2330 domain-containing protein [Mycobacterium sp.]